ncbi:gluconokinase [Janibacter sp. G1551]|uniref:gluconokinase n=1 Tax=Janibacter sp. G1551 TaxID=3420440 RepID=UPI003CFBE640
MTDPHPAVDPADTRHIVVMGVSSSGKSTVAEAIAERTTLEYADADDFHPQSNIDKLSNGVQLTDADRAPWLRALAQFIDDKHDAGVSTVIACSALKRSYRDTLRSGVPEAFEDPAAGRLERERGVEIVHLDGPIEVVRARMDQRQGHFMAKDLLQSQYDELEPLGPDEPGIVIDLTQEADAMADEAVDRLDLPRVNGSPAER